jgi:acetyltransferase-like isoleucine patch superfamily enzyme
LVLDKMELFGRKLKINSAVSKYAFFGWLVSTTFALLKGAIYQLVYTSFKGRLVLARGAVFANPKLIKINQLCRIGVFSVVRCYTKDGIILGKNFSLGAYSSLSNGFNVFSSPGSLTIGDDVGIGEYAYICAVAPVTIGSDTIVGQYLSVHPQNHHFDEKSILIRHQGTSELGVNIGANCWIGSKVTFLDGSSVGDGCVVAAGAVVTKAFPGNVIIAGNPAKVLRER